MSHTILRSISAPQRRTVPASLDEFRISNILAATDLGNTSVAALMYAKRFTDAFDAKLTVLYSDPIFSPADLFHSLISTSPSQRELSEEISRHAGLVLAPSAYHSVVTSGSPAGAIVKWAIDHANDLIVIGSHHHHPFERLLTGSTSNDVLSGSPCPVLMVRNDGTTIDQVPLIRTVLVPINFTRTSREAAHAAAAIASRFRAHVLAVHVIDGDAVVDRWDHESRLRDWIRSEVDGHCSYRELVVRGTAADRILHCAEDLGASMMVIGADRNLRHNMMTLGTTAERLMRGASCPVLVVPASRRDTS